MSKSELINQTKQSAIAFIKQQKDKTNISRIRKATQFSERWFYKVADGSITPSYERSLIILEYKDAA